MKKFRFDVILSLSIATLCTILAYQNCAKQKYSQVNSTGVAGQLGSLDTSSGEIPVDVSVDNCSNVSDLEKPICQKDIKLNLYAEKSGAPRVLVSSILASPKVVSDLGTEAVKYVGIFKVNVADLACKTAVVMHETEAGEVEIGRSKIGGSGCEEVVDGSFSIDKVDQVKELFEASGKCSGSAPIAFSGDLSAFASKNAVCSSSSYKFCSTTPKSGMNNTIQGSQSGKSDTRTFLGKGSPQVYITIDDSYFNSATTPLMVKGRCTPLADIKILIYGNDVTKSAPLKCSASGTWQFNGNVLVPTLTDRRLDVIVSHAFGTMSIYTNIDSTTAAPAKITAKVSNAAICKNVAGTVSGTCRAGLPIELKVNMKAAGIQVCNGGTFKFENVLLHTLGSNNKITVEQMQTGATGATYPAIDTANITTF